MTDQLIPDIGDADPTDLSDLLLILAKNVEEAFLESGARPGDDYGRLDLFELALPFAVEIWRSNPQKMSFVESW